MNKHPEWKQEQLEAENKELLSQNKWLKAQIESIAGQHAPLEPIPDQEGWSRKLPGYDLVSLLRDAERYRWLSVQGNWISHFNGKWRANVEEQPVTDWFDTQGEAIDAARNKGEQS